MLFIGERVGAGGPKIDIALDPLEGTTLTAKGGPNALAVIAMAEAGGFLNAPDTYMEKIAVGGGLPEDIVDLDATPLPRFRDYRVASAASAGLVAEAAGLIAGAERPMLMAGTSLKWSEGGPALRRFAEATNVPVFTNGMARGQLPMNHPQFFNRTRRDALGRADVVILAGTPLDFRMKYGASIPADTTIVQLDLDETLIGQNRAADVGLVGNLGANLDALLASLGDLDASAWSAELRALEADAEEALMSQLDSDEVPIDPMRLCREIADFVDTDDEMIVIGSILLLQFVGVPFALLFGHLGSRVGPKRTSSWRTRDGTHGGVTGRGGTERAAITARSSRSHRRHPSRCRRRCGCRCLQTAARAPHRAGRGPQRPAPRGRSVWRRARRSTPFPGSSGSGSSGRHRRARVPGYASQSRQWSSEPGLAKPTPSGVTASHHREASSLDAASNAAGSSSRLVSAAKGKPVRSRASKGASLWS